MLKVYMKVCFALSIIPKIRSVVKFAHSGGVGVGFGVLKTKGVSAPWLVVLEKRIL